MGAIGSAYFRLVSADWFLDRIDAVVQAAEAARAALNDASDVLEPAREKWLAGEPVASIAVYLHDQGAERRRLVASRLHDYERSVADLRAAVVYALVQEAGASLTQVADGMGISRQGVAKLYQTGAELQGKPE